MYRISPFTPLFFGPSTDRYGIASRHVQVFAPGDRIVIEVLVTGGDDAPVMWVEFADGSGREILYPVTWKMNANVTVLVAVLTGLGNGCYRVGIGEQVSELFRVTDDRLVLDGTTLIRYSGMDNRERGDVVFLVDGLRYWFDYRAEGGFKDDGWSFGVDNEQFVSAAADRFEVFARDSIEKTFTLGSGYGVPVWHGALLNRLLTCRYVFFDGQRYTRNESETPEMNQTVEGQKSFIFKQGLVPVLGAEGDVVPEMGMQLRWIDDGTDKHFRDLDKQPAGGSAEGSGEGSAGGTAEGLAGDPAEDPAEGSEGSVNGGISKEGESGNGAGGSGSDVSLITNYKPRLIWN